MKDRAQISCFPDKTSAKGRFELLRLFRNGCLSATFWGNYSGREKNHSRNLQYEYHQPQVITASPTLWLPFLQEGWSGLTLTRAPQNWDRDLWAFSCCPPFRYSSWRCQRYSLRGPVYLGNLHLMRLYWLFLCVCFPGTGGSHLFTSAITVLEWKPRLKVRRGRTV